MTSVNKEDLREVLESEEGIEAAYLHGSFAKGREHEESDVDIGVLVTDGQDFNFNDISRISSRLEERTGRKVDLRVLNSSDIRFVNNVLKDGEIIFSEDEETRRNFEENILKKYLDMKPFIDEYDRFVRERVTG